MKETSSYNKMTALHSNEEVAEKEPITHDDSHPGAQIKEEQGSEELYPRFSIILCTYNRRNKLLATLASLRRQTLPAKYFEVIVIDDGSTDDTVNAVRTYVNACGQHARRADDSWYVQCLTRPQKSLAQARNIALEAASGEIAVFLNDDTLVDPYFLEYLLGAFEETGADAIGGRVELRWEAPRPQWLSDDLLDMLGYFSPLRKRAPLPTCINFSSCNFSVKRAILQQMGGFSTFFGKQFETPCSIETEDLCRRLRKTGYTLWYEPGVAVTQRVPAAHVKAAFFRAQAYWQGRSEVLTQYADSQQHKDRGSFTLRGMLSAMWPALRDIIQLALFDRPILFLAGKPGSERLQAAMAQARSLGQIWQRLRIIEHAPGEIAKPSVLLVCSNEQDVTLLTRGFQEQGVRYLTSVNRLPLAWLWQYRAYKEQSIGIVHWYQPGSLQLNSWQRQGFYWKIWLAERLGISTVATDSGGWWQSVSGMSAFARRSFEQKLFACSDIVFAYTRQPEHLYIDTNVRRRVRCLIHPGLRGYYPDPVESAEAYEQLGLDEETTYVYLCLASLHTEREIIHLIDAFSEALLHKSTLRLLVVGFPRDKKQSQQILKRAAHNSAIHIAKEESEEEIPLLIGAANALVMPHFALQQAGVLAMAMLFISNERVVVAPNLPRFRGMLPPHTCVLYESGSLTALVQALITAQTRNYQFTEKERVALDAKAGWRQNAQRLLNAYKRLLSHAP